MAILPTERITVLSLIEQFIASKEASGDHEAMLVGAYYRKHLKRFGRMYSTARAGDIRVRDLQFLKEDMLELGYANKTVNHDLTAVKGTLQFGMDMEYIPPFNLRGCRSLPTGPVQHKALPIAEVQELLGETSSRGGPEPGSGSAGQNYRMLDQ